jgi:cyclohexanecarboxylate-CoA ligase
MAHPDAIWRFEGLHRKQNGYRSAFRLNRMPRTDNEFRERGYWLDKTPHQLLAEAVARYPDKLAVVSDRADRMHERRFTYAELSVLVERAAASFSRIGVTRGDIITVQLPNWWEFVVTALACSMIGAVINPVMPILRERELLYILSFCKSKVLIVPKIYRGFDYECMVDCILTGLPDLAHLIVVGGDENSFESVLLPEERDRDAAQAVSDELRPDELCLVMFTSGTTGTPKGVMHHANAMIACTKSLAISLGLSSEDILLVSTPMGHMAGYVALMMESIYLGATMILQDVWSVQRGMELMVRENVTFTAVTPLHLLDICDAVKAGANRPERLRLMLCTGSPIPSVLIERAAAELGLVVCSLWGMTEALGATLTNPASALRKAATTDGSPVAGMQIRVVDGEGNDKRSGESGRLLVRGSQMFMGYYRSPDAAVDEGGWLDSGDLAYIDEEGYVRISGRMKDVVIRGGENIPVVEIENILYEHPNVAAVAIVGFPDARLGERACAFIVQNGGPKLDLPALQAFLAINKVSKQFWPERLELVAHLPRTASGKIQKFKLKEMLRSSVTNGSSDGLE